MKPNLFRSPPDENEIDSEFVELVIEQTAYRRGLRRDQVRASLLRQMLEDAEREKMNSECQGLKHQTLSGVH
ncbi:hypothetical protein SBX64_15935 [Vibrio rhizosphaerae]|uniref:CopG family transcriptional regulator n=1 Tax=Vibrio rhizosphaerae TaxID=398736 RepID=A0ABU4IXA1_9VIBR|nr:hypothetical protein [Vibrio rhizosphaerae]MDW6094029.1 hypothetical protein [Vibrio rhizosphaerae]